MRAVGHYIRGRLSWLPLLEALALFQAMVLGYELRFIGEEHNLPALHGIVFAGILLLSMTGLGLYDTEREESFRQTIQRVFMAYLISMIALSLLFYVLPEAKFGRGIFAIATVFALGSILTIRYIAHRAVEAANPARKVLVIGDQEDIDDIRKTINLNNTRAASRIAGLYPLSDLTQSSPEDAAFASEHISQRVMQQNIREIVVACREQRNGAVPMDLLLNLRLGGTKVFDLLTFYERELGLIKLNHLRRSWLVFGDGFDQSTARTLIKRSFDLIVSGSLLLVASPLILLAMLAIYLETGTPLIFRQVRTGENGKDFPVLKLRSMQIDAEKDGTPKWATKNDDRITKVGRFIRTTRVDELPQLLNVFSGDMSFVGPRPERPYFVDQLREQIPFYDMRHKVKPGITGWAQVRLPYGGSVEATRQKLEYDLYYVKNNSILFDLIIMFETVRVVLRRKGQ